MNRKTWITATGLMAGAWVWGCAAAAGDATRAAPAGGAPAAAVSPADVKGSVHRIDLPEMASSWPEGAGRDVVEVNCGVCHSGRYLTMQPVFPRKTWEAQVKKMREVFGAPIPETNVKTIVDYLVAVRGKE